MMRKYDLLGVWKFLYWNKGCQIYMEKIRGLKISSEKIRGLKILSFSEENTPGGYSPGYNKLYDLENSSVPNFRGPFNEGVEKIKLRENTELLVTLYFQ